MTLAGKTAHRVVAVYLTWAADRPRITCRGYVAMHFDSGLLWSLQRERSDRQKKMRISSRITHGRGVLQLRLWFIRCSLYSLTSYSPSLSLKKTSPSKWFSVIVITIVSDTDIFLCKLRKKLCSNCVSLKILKTNLKCPTVLVLCMTVTLSSSPEILSNSS